MKNRLVLVRKAPAYPKLMRRLGLLPNLSEAELRAIKYANEARCSANVKAAYKRKLEAR